MQDHEILEWEFDSPELRETPFTASTTDARFRQELEQFESPFIAVTEVEAPRDMENLAADTEVHECKCGCRDGQAEAEGEADGLVETEALEGFESEASSCGAGCPEPSPAYLKRIKRRGNPQGSVTERPTQGDPAVNLALQLFDYDVNEYRISKFEHQKALARVTEFVLDRLVKTSETIAITITGSASRTGTQAFNDTLSCQRAECAAANLRLGLDRFRGFAERVRINTAGEGFARATCKGSDCELGEWRSVLVSVHAPNSPPKPIPVVDPGWDKYAIRCNSFHTTKIMEALLGDLLNKALPNVPEKAKKTIIAGIKKGFARLVKELSKKAPKLGAALSDLNALLRFFPAEIIREEGVFEIRERRDPPENPRAQTFHYQGHGLRVLPPPNLDQALDDAIGKVPGLNKLPDFVKKQLKDAIKQLIPKAVVDRVQPIDSDTPGSSAQFDLNEKRDMRVFCCSVQIGKGIWMPGQVNVEFASKPWILPAKVIRPLRIKNCPDTDCNEAGVQVVVGTRKGIELFSITGGDFTGGRCVCAPPAVVREFESNFESETEFAGEFESEFAGEAEGEYGGEAEGEFGGEAEGESFEQPELPAHVPAGLTLHQLLNSPATRHAAMAGLLGPGASRTVRFNGADVPIATYLRMMSRLCREAAEQSEAEGETPSALIYGDAESRHAYYQLFLAAFRGVAGKAQLPARQRAELAASIARAAIAAGGDRIASEEWKQAFLAALESTSAGQFHTPDEAANKAVELAGCAVAAAGGIERRP